MSEILETERLLLCPPAAADVPLFAPLIGDYAITKNLATVPYPYSEEDSHRWVNQTTHKRALGEGYTFMICRRADGVLIGACGVHPGAEFEFGYWLGVPYWGLGCAPEAGIAVVIFAFTLLATRALWAGSYDDNPALSRVLTKLRSAKRGRCKSPVWRDAKTSFAIAWNSPATPSPGAWYETPGAVAPRLRNVRQ